MVSLHRVERWASVAYLAAFAGAGATFSPLLMLALPCYPFLVLYAEYRREWPDRLRQWGAGGLLGVFAVLLVDGIAGIGTSLPISTLTLLIAVTVLSVALPIRVLTDSRESVGEIDAPEPPISIDAVRTATLVLYLVTGLLSVAAALFFVGVTHEVIGLQVEFHTGYLVLILLGFAFQAGFVHALVAGLAVALKHYRNESYSRIEAVAAGTYILGSPVYGVVESTGVELGAYVVAIVVLGGTLVLPVATARDLDLLPFDS